MQVVELVAQAAACRAGVIAGAIDQRLQGLQLTAQLLQGVLGVKQCAAGLHLAHDAAALFAGVDGAVVDAALDIAGLAAHDAADVITDVQVAHGAAVEAGTDHAGGSTGDTANVGDVSGILGADQIVQRQLREVDFVLVDGGVDVGVVAAVDDHAVVFTHDAADEVGTVDAAGGGAVVDGAAAQVGTGDAAHNGCAGGNALEPAVDERTGVAAYDAAYGGAAAGGHRAASDGQIMYHAVGLDVAEEARHRAVVNQAQAADGVAVAVKGAAEGGDTGKVNAGQVQVGVQVHRAVLTPGVETAIGDQLQKVFHTVDGDRQLLSLPSFCPDGQGQHQQQRQGSQPGQQAAREVQLGVHSASPPFVVSAGSFGDSSVAVTSPSGRYISGSSTVTSVPVEMLALNWPCSTPLISASTTPLM